MKFALSKNKAQEIRRKCCDTSDEKLKTTALEMGILILNSNDDHVIINEIFANKLATTVFPDIHNHLERKI